MQTPPRLIPLYTSRGDVGAYLAYPYIYSAHGEWIGWAAADRKVFSVHGHYVGLLTPELRIVRKRESGASEPRRTPPPLPAPLRPPAHSPLAPQMPDLAQTLMDVLEEGHDLMPPMDTGMLRDDMDSAEQNMNPDSRSSKTSSASRVTLSMLMQPEHANNHGNVHGGWIMKLVDEAGALACMRHAQQRVVTIVVDQMVFRQPIRMGDLVTITAEVSYVGRTSMEAEVHVIAENPITGVCTHTNTAYVVYVALAAEGEENVPVPGLILETEDQRLRFEEGKARQQYRLEQARKRESRQVS